MPFFQRRSLSTPAHSGVVRHGQTTILEESAQCMLLSHGIAEGRGREAPRAFDERVLAGGPGEEVVDEATRDVLSPRVTLRRCQRLPLLFELEELAHPQERLARGGV